MKRVALVIDRGISAITPAEAQTLDPAQVHQIRSAEAVESELRLKLAECVVQSQRPSQTAAERAEVFDSGIPANAKTIVRKTDGACAPFQE